MRARRKNVTACMELLLLLYIQYESDKSWLSQIIYCSVIYFVDRIEIL